MQHLVLYKFNAKSNIYNTVTARSHGFRRLTAVQTNDVIPEDYGLIQAQHIKSHRQWSLTVSDRVNVTALSLAQ